MKFADFLHPEHVRLRQAGDDPWAARDALLDLLTGDPRLTDPAQLRNSIQERNAGPLFDGETGLWICHGRTNAVTSLLLGLSTHDPGLVFPDAPGRVVLLLVAGIPSAFDQQYLQLIGGLVRLFRTPAAWTELWEASTSGEFIEQLDELRMAL